jgi:hypothetical protein
MKNGFRCRIHIQTEQERYMFDLNVFFLMAKAANATVTNNGRIIHAGNSGIAHAFDDTRMKCKVFLNPLY